MRKFMIGIGLVVAAALVLILSDLGQRRGVPKHQKSKRIAVFQFSSRPGLDESVAGILAGLREGGYTPDDNLQVTFFNAEGSTTDAAAIARTIADSGFDLAVTASTPCLQALATANKDGKVNHVFCTVTNPFSAGVGLSQDPKTPRPRHLTGVATLQPVRELFLLARRLLPTLRRVGTAWCTSEACSEQCLQLARQTCSELGIQLEEVPVTASPEVAEAIHALVARNVQAIWVGGDNVVELAVPNVVQICREAKIPCLTNAPNHAEAGAFIGLGADYYTVGKVAGSLAVRVLNGESPASIPIENRVPQQLAVNFLDLNEFREPWAIPAELKSAIDIQIDAQGVHRKLSPLSRRWRVRLISFNESSLTEDSARGIRDGLRDSGLVENRDYVLTAACAQGDMSVIPSLFDAALTSGVDLFLTISTPTLQAAIQKIQDTPIVFTTVADPFTAGAGKTDDHHLPNVTGVYTIGPYADMANLLTTHFPQFKKIGTLFCPSESNSVANKQLFTQVCQAKGIEVIAIPANTSNELAEAAQALCQRHPDAIVQIIDNLSAAGFDAIAQAARKARLPLLCHTSDGVRKGAALGLCRDYDDAGRQAVAMAVRIMRGEMPGRIPFSPPRKKRLVISPVNARNLGFQIPAALVEAAEEVVP